MNGSDQAFTNQTMMTCIGNKRKFLSNIESIINEIKQLLNKDNLNIFDAFSGSTIISRMLSYHAKKIITNDLEYYSYIMANCYLNTPSKTDQIKINNHINEINNMIGENNFIEGIISNNYAPKDTYSIKDGERCFFTRENALIIDTIRKYIDDNIEEKYKYYILGCLLVKSSIHNNTGGHFKSFYKSKATGIGCWGGDGENSIGRIKGIIKLETIIWNNSNKYELETYNMDTNELIKQLDDDLDVIYIDPPYNLHPYGSNYFMLNTIAQNKLGEHISKISGIPYNWNKSNYNYKKTAITSMKSLLEIGLQKSKYIILSYNNEGIIKKEEWDEIFKMYNVKHYNFIYDTYKASRNLKKRANKVVEYIYLISKST